MKKLLILLVPLVLLMSCSGRLNKYWSFTETSVVINKNLVEKRFGGWSDLKYTVTLAQNSSIGPISRDVIVGFYNDWQKLEKGERITFDKVPYPEEVSDVQKYAGDVP